MEIHTDAQDHEWATASRHRTSEGTVSYQHCRCGAQRILAAPAPEGGLVAVVPAS